MSSAKFADPDPVKLDHATSAIVQAIRTKLNITRSEVLRRAVQFSAPKFASGEVDIMSVQPPPPVKKKLGKWK